MPACYNAWIFLAGIPFMDGYVLIYCIHTLDNTTIHDYFKATLLYRGT